MKILVFFGLTRLDEMLKKGNAWYVCHYGTYFDKVYVVYLSGDPHEPLNKGNTTLISLGSGVGIINFILAPYRLYKFANKIKPTTYLTADLVFSWWTSWMVKLVHGGKINLMPVCIPNQIYKNRGKSLSNFPIWFESILIYISFFFANRILTGKSIGNFVNWLSLHPLAKNKLITVNTLVELLPSNDFFENLQTIKQTEPSYIISNHIFMLVYVGRLHKEKLVDDLIKMMSYMIKINDSSISIMLKIIGVGHEKQHLERMAKEYGIDKLIRFEGTIHNENLPGNLLKSSAFVSTLTGTSLREAALCGLPIIAYDMDWISGLLEHEKNALLVPPGDYNEMACQVMRLVKDKELYLYLSRNIKDLAWRLWSPLDIQHSLHQAFKED